MNLRISAELQLADAFRLQVDTELPLQGVTALFGRSGCGKTTLLRIVAGLERVRGARVQFAGQCWQDGRQFVPLHRRRIGLVFQEPSLLPHLSARDNLLYGYRRTPEALRRLHPDQVCALLGIGELLERRIDQLSGGQRQRFALGRALLTSPQLLLLDEPLSALDSQTKREIMPFLSRLAVEAGVPMLLVTHAPEEVQRLADRVVFMQDGRIQRIESLQQALARPDSPLFADQGAASILLGELGEPQSDGLRAFGSAASRLWLSSRQPARPGQLQRLHIRAQDVSLALDDPQRISIQNHLPVRIERIDPIRPSQQLVSCRTADGQLLLAEVTRRAVEQLQLAPGLAVYALIKSVALLE